MPGYSLKGRCASSATAPPTTSARKAAAKITRKRIRSALGRFQNSIATFAGPSSPLSDFLDARGQGMFHRYPLANLLISADGYTTEMEPSRRDDAQCMLDERRQRGAI